MPPGRDGLWRLFSHISFFFVQWRIYGICAVAISCQYYASQVHFIIFIPTCWPNNRILIWNVLLLVHSLVLNYIFGWAIKMKLVYALDGINSAVAFKKLRYLRYDINYVTCNQEYLLTKNIVHGQVQVFL